MGFLDKVFFWRKEDEIDALANQEISESADFLDDQKLGMEEKSPFPEPDVPPFPPTSSHKEQTSMPNRDLELISSKLDTLKAMLTSLDQRMSNLERAAGVVEQKKGLW